MAIDKSPNSVVYVRGSVHRFTPTKGALCVLLIFFSGFHLLSHWARIPTLTGVHRRLEILRPDDHCSKLKPIARGEFRQRQINLVQSLRSLNASAYVAEPGANTFYYLNISQSHWSLSERPFLSIITSNTDGTDEAAEVYILTPMFEATRAKSLLIPTLVKFIEWREDENPYTVAAATLENMGTIYVDGSIRKFIADGLQKAISNASVMSAPPAITSIREQKSKTELDILRCANEATLLSIRRTRKRMYIGIHESEARAVMTAIFADAGLENGKCLILFGANAALPHGSGSDRALGPNDFALFDCTASVYGYYSDVTRTFALPDSNISENHLRIWNHVRSAQDAAFEAARVGVIAKKVDETARSLLEHLGYGQYFTHRLGHGIGLEVHEQPYIHGGSMDVIQNGHTFSDEPGIYIEGEDLGWSASRRLFLCQRQWYARVFDSRRGRAKCNALVTVTEHGNDTID